ncbi:MAG: 3',5'-nucleoside bisphosphate phosphatase [Planctomycetes bacterium]|nr:3',5'-nucleoside bisphosphate phosphatase [Planctomycetota bacterium]
MTAASVTAAFCDLHVHSTASDGSVPPRDVVRLARDAGLAAFALTDHDTMDGYAEACDEGAKLGVRVVPGVELSVPHEGTCHVIALGVTPGHPSIEALASRFRRGREERNEGIVAKLRALGIDVTMEDVRREAKGAIVARPHFAAALVKKGAVRNQWDAFERYLAKGAPAYVDRDRADLADVVRSVRAAGGATVICHPFTLGYDDSEETLDFLVSARNAGVDALEVRYGRYTRSDEKRWEKLAGKAGLLPSGGSDFHGAAKPGIKVGSGSGRMRVPLEWLDALLDRAASRG